MTDAQIKAQELQLREQELEEKKRSNREQERQGRKKAGASVADTALKGATQAGRLLLKAFNDVAWYSLNKQLMLDVANVSFHTPLGSSEFLQYGTPFGAVPIFIQPSRAVAGICAVHFEFACGKDGETSLADGVNIAAQNIYSFVRNVNSGARNYQSSDLMMYIITINAAGAYIAALARIYSVLKTYKTENYYYNGALLQALGVPASSLEYWRNNLAQLRATINNAFQRLRTFAVPKTMPLIQRWIWLVTQIFKDAAVKRSQLYVFVPNHYYYLDWEDAALIGFSANYTSLDTVVKDLNNIFTGIFGNNDIGTMSGDVLKAYGEAGLLEFASIGEDYHIESVYNEEVLSQIGSARLTGKLGYIQPNGVFVEYVPTIYQQEGTQAIGMGQIKADPGTFNDVQPLNNSYQFSVNANATSVSTPINRLAEYNGSWVINMYKDDVMPGDVMVATRLIPVVTRKVQWAASGIAEITNSIQSCGSEIATHVEILSFQSAGTSGLDNFVQKKEIFGINSSWIVANSTTSATTQGVIKDASAMATYAQFDWAPRVLGCVVGCAYSGNTPEPYEATFYDSVELQNFARVDAAALRNMHNVAISSEFAIPLLGPKPFKQM